MYPSPSSSCLRVLKITRHVYINVQLEMKLSSDKGENWFYILTIYIIHACMHCIRPCNALLL